jgi:hypothetical protein
MSTTRGRELLDAGVDVLKPILEPLGFVFELSSEGPSSGGHFASGQFVAEDRRLEIHARHSLGLVAYHWGSVSIGHEDLTRALGVRGSYPGYSFDPVDGFRRLRADLEGPLAPFLTGDAFEWFVDAVDSAEPPPKLP